MSFESMKALWWRLLRYHGKSLISPRSIQFWQYNVQNVDPRAISQFLPGNRQFWGDVGKMDTRRRDESCG